MEERKKRTPGDLHKALDEAHGRIVDLSAQVNKLNEMLNDWAETYRKIIDDRGPNDEAHCSCVPALRTEIDRLRAKYEHPAQDMTADGTGLKLCPFCGCQMILDHERFHFGDAAVHPATDCVISSQSFPLHRWNKRPTQGDLIAQLGDTLRITVLALQALREIKRIAAKEPHHFKPWSDVNDICGRALASANGAP
jgi:hypothetical protein